ncbi:hypothetical protein PVAP13_3KG246327 [Panicum virgatum]|uniref:Uncharacterized protein n=1 Tax=Panicum virgatum TaxID=38727 RepID=A0A8T0UVQ3_PANVG|nr:hypothetical protein PVAP13_3KG246327 [Panicum virgatum]
MAPPNPQQHHHSPPCPFHSNGWRSGRSFPFVGNFLSASSSLRRNPKQLVQLAKVQGSARIPGLELGHYLFQASHDESPLHQQTSRDNLAYLSLEKLQARRMLSQMHA